MSGAVCYNIGANDIQVPAELLRSIDTCTTLILGQLVRYWLCVVPVSSASPEVRGRS